jgi:hypothetical protein
VNNKGSDPFVHSFTIIYFRTIIYLVSLTITYLHHTVRARCCMLPIPCFRQIFILYVAVARVKQPNVSTTTPLRLWMMGMEQTIK